MCSTRERDRDWIIIEERHEIRQMQKLRAEKDSSIKKELRRRHRFNYHEDVGRGDGVSWTSPILKFSQRYWPNQRGLRSQKVSQRKIASNTNKLTQRDREIERDTEKNLKAIGWHDFSVMVDNNPTFLWQILQILMPKNWLSLLLLRANPFSNQSP